MKITHVHGLHARASTRFVEIAQSFRSDVFLSKEGQEVDGKSVLGILTLGVELDHEITLRVCGSDCQEAFAALKDLIERDFDGV